MKDFNITILADNRTFDYKVKGLKIDYFEGVETFWYINSNFDVVLTEMKTGCSIFVIPSFHFDEQKPNDKNVRDILDLLLKNHSHINKEEIQKRIDLFFTDTKQLRLLTGDCKHSF